jgi:hypothetical protein
MPARAGGSHVELGLLGHPREWGRLARPGDRGVGLANSLGLERGG